MKLRKKNNYINVEPIDIISNYLYDIDEIKNKMVKNNIVKYDIFDEEPIKFDDDLIKWMCSFTAKDFI